MNEPATFVRRLARLLVRHAANILRGTRSSWSDAMENELEHIESGNGALIWAIGCVWAAYIDRYASRARPVLSAVLLLVALLLIARYFLAFLVWYGVSLGGLGLPDARAIAPLKLALCLGVIGLAGAAAPGRWRWRVLAGAAFPFLAFLSFLAVAWIAIQASGLITSLPWPHGQTWFFVKFGIAGLIFGAALTVVMSLPFALVYRSRAVPIAILALMPEVSNFIEQIVHGTNLAVHPVMILTAFIWPWLCALSGVALGALWCNRWLPRWPEKGPTGDRHVGP
jgi:hypothetical protein